MLMRRLATPLLYGITPTDPLTLVAVSCTLMLVGAVATWLRGCPLDARRGSIR